MFKLSIPCNIIVERLEFHYRLYVESNNSTTWNLENRTKKNQASRFTDFKLQYSRSKNDNLSRISTS